MSGITQGFKIGYGTATVPSLKDSRRNLHSAYENPCIVDEYLAKERAEGRLLGPIPRSFLTDSYSTLFHSSPFGVIPKKRQPGKWRLIVDLSSPRNHSVNDGIDSSCCSLHYSGLEEAVAMVNKLGRGTRLAKLIG